MVCFLFLCQKVCYHKNGVTFAGILSVNIQMETNGNQIKQKLSTDYNCKLCDYNSSKKCNYEKHLKSVKHQNALLETIGNKKKQKVADKSSSKYSCEFCDYISSRKSNLEKHLKTMSHKSATFGEKVAKVAKNYCCDKCSKTFANNSGLWKHNQRCNNTNNVVEVTNPNHIDKELILMIIKQNSELVELVKNGTHNNIYNNTISHSHNKTFNMNVFLNETCKNAMNIDDFVSSVQPTIEELEETGKVGYIAGITNVILKRLNKLELSMKPMHCSDAKREILYIKDKDVWEKETTDKPLLTGAIKMVAHKNMKNINEWRDLYPDCNDAYSHKNNEYLRIVSNSMSGGSSDECDKNLNRIISNIAKESVIER